MVILPSQPPKPTIIKPRVEYTNNLKYKHLYRCFCQNEFIAIAADVNAGRTKSCGCWATLSKRLNTKHSMNKSPEHDAWVEMKRRCFDITRPNYSDYGGRGITVDASWKHDFKAFFDHIGPKPEPLYLYSLDRINNNGNYEPGNVRWATREQQNNNQRKHKRAKTR